MKGLHALRRLDQLVAATFDFDVAAMNFIGGYADSFHLAPIREVQ